MLRNFFLTRPRLEKSYVSWKYVFCFSFVRSLDAWGGLVAFHIIYTHRVFRTMCCAAINTYNKIHNERFIYSLLYFFYFTTGAIYESLWYILFGFYIRRWTMYWWYVDLGYWEKEFRRFLEVFSSIKRELKSYWRIFASFFMSWKSRIDLGRSW